MPDDLQEWLSILEASRILPNRPHKNTVTRYATRGVYGVKLKTIRFGGRRLTRRDWVNEFIKALTNASPDPYADNSTPTAAQTAAEAKLNALGIH